MKTTSDDYLKSLWIAAVDDRYGADSDESARVREILETSDKQEAVAEMQVARDGRGNTRITWKTLRWDTPDGTYQLYARPLDKSAAQDWISVEDRLPDAPGEYLLFRPTAHLPPASDPNVTIREYFGPEKAGNDKFGGSHEVTHWMPLPCAPAAEA